jgi:hypothetical protein
MKKTIVKAALLLTLIAAAAVFFSSCLLNTGVKTKYYSNFPKGFTEKEEHFDPDGFQDYTDYCKYYYENAEGFEKDSRFTSVSEVGTEAVKGYFDNFRNWMETCDRLSEYDFDPSIITNDDYVRIVTREDERIGRDGRYGKYDDYTVYFFDTGTNTMYYIHNNI